ncbi:hypothetical protein MMC19_005903 [Ptychographa xylographoides]|nr:hypothetical protein [Ptychographa xylographoides]
MTTIHHAHQRTSPPHLKKLAARSHRPSTLSRAPSSPKIPVKAGKGKAIEQQVETEEDEDDMTTSFLQYCAMCEKQIVVPNNAILYCSENCRRRDSSKVPNVESYYNAYAMTTLISPEPMDIFGLTTRSIVPRSQPTVLPSFQSKPPMLHNFKSDLDPTEWKPDLHHRPTSEAFQYLSQYHRTPDGLNMAHRTVMRGRSTASAVMMAHTAPSLSHTPTTSTTSSEGSIAGTPYDFVGSTIPPADESSSSSLVEAEPFHDASVRTPIAGMKTAKKNPTGSPIIGDIVYEKKWIANSVEHISGSLKKLLYLQELSGTGAAAGM